MKQLLTISILTVFLFSCSTKAKRIKGDTCIVSILFKNPYNQNTVSALASIRLVKDSVKVDEETEKAVHRADTTYFIELSIPVPDPKDSTHKTQLKTKSGADSFVVRLAPITPKNILIDFNDRQPYK